MANCWKSDDEFIRAEINADKCDLVRIHKSMAQVLTVNSPMLLLRCLQSYRPAEPRKMQELHQLSRIHSHQNSVQVEVVSKSLRSLRVDSLLEGFQPLSQVVKQVRLYRSTSELTSGENWIEGAALDG
jgi:hypothetical protein